LARSVQSAASAIRYVLVPLAQIHSRRRVRTRRRQHRRRSAGGASVVAVGPITNVPNGPRIALDTPVVERPDRDVNVLDAAGGHLPYLVGFETPTGHAYFGQALFVLGPTRSGQAESWSTARVNCRSTSTLQNRPPPVYIFASVPDGAVEVTEPR